MDTLVQCESVIKYLVKQVKELTTNQVIKASVDALMEEVKKVIVRDLPFDMLIDHSQPPMPI